MVTLTDELGAPGAGDPWASTHALTKPVYHAVQRAMPRWIGWLLIALPTLALFGTWLAGRFPLFQLVVAVLLVVAGWDWSRYFDRSRTMLGVFSLSTVIIVASTLAILMQHPPSGAAALQSVALLTMMALAVALVQLYRSAETVLTLTRGWLYAVVIIVGITAYQRITSTVPVLNGPFPSPGYLAGSLIAGLVLVPVGFALEPDRRLRWLYVAAGLGTTWVIWTTHRSVAVICAIVVLLAWLALWRWWLGAGVAVILAVAGLVFRRLLAWRWAEVGLEPRLPPSIHAWLAEQAWLLTVQSTFLGVGPGGLSARWQPAEMGYAGPYSAVMEIMAELGVGATVVLLAALVALVVWCVRRLIATRGEPWRSANRSPAVWLLIMIGLLPLTTTLQAVWLSFPMSALFTATLVLLARHIEAPRGRPVQSRTDAWDSTPAV